MRFPDFQPPAPGAGFLLLGGRGARLLKRHNTRILVWPALIWIVALSACSAATAPSPTSTPGEPEPTSSETTTVPTAIPPTDAPASAAFPQQHTDALGREVIVSARPDAIVSLAPSVTEMLFAIGAGPQVVGRTEFDNYPPEVESLPTVGGFTSSTISMETILDLEPDLVIAGARAQADIVEALEAAGITAYVLEPASLDEIQSGMLTLGDMTGNPEGAGSVVDDMAARVAAVEEKVEDVPAEERVTVFYEIWHEPLTTTTSKTYIGELITLAGGTNIFGDLSGEYPTISAEEIIDLDPDIIIGPSSHGDQLTAEIIAARPGWEDLSAVQESAIYIVDGDVISRPGPRIVGALETVAAYLYPDPFSE